LPKTLDKGKDKPTASRLVTARRKRRLGGRPLGSKSKLVTAVETFDIPGPGKEQGGKNIKG